MEHLKAFFSMNEQLISPIPFGLSIKGTRTVFFMVLNIERCVNRSISVDNENIFLPLFVGID